MRFFWQESPFSSFLQKTKNITFIYVKDTTFTKKSGKLNDIILKKLEKTVFLQVLLINGTSLWRHNLKILILNKSIMGGPISINLVPLGLYWKRLSNEAKIYGGNFSCHNHFKGSCSFSFVKSPPKIKKL